MDESQAQKIDIKAQTSGSTLKKKHRQCGTKTGPGDYFADTVKHMLATNENDMPEFNTLDEAELARIIMMRFRAKFVDNPEEYKRDHPDSKHVFPKDGTLAKRDFRIDMMNWLLPVYGELSRRNFGGEGVVDLVDEGTDGGGPAAAVDADNERCGWHGAVQLWKFPNRAFFSHAASVDQRHAEPCRNSAADARRAL